MTTTAICAGSFDPITLGHLNIIRRASGLFDQVVVCLVYNSEKRCTFTREERLDQIRRVTARLGNVRADTWDGLLVEYAKRYEHPVLVRGLRAMSDFEYEFQMALTNKKMAPDIETVFLAASEKYTYLSSSIVREIAGYGADITDFVPVEILQEVRERLQSGRRT